MKELAIVGIATIKQPETTTTTTAVTTQDVLLLLQPHKRYST